MKPLFHMQSETRRNLKLHWPLVLFILPALAYIAIFHYGPMYGIIMAFEDYKPHLGVFGSEWVGFSHFHRFFNLTGFVSIMRNTVLLSIYTLIAGFPLPIVLALMLNSCTNQFFKKTVQTVSYAPHFISMVVMCGLILIFFSPSQGIVRNLLVNLGFMGKYEYLNVLNSPAAFPHLYVWSSVWQEIGFGSIIYLGALTSVDPSLHEAAVVDGASKIQRVRHIDIPSISSTMIVLLILNSGKIMSVGFEKVFLLQNAMNLERSQVLSTYTYQVGIKEGQYSFSTTVSLFNSIINFILLVTVNSISRKVSSSSLW